MDAHEVTNRQFAAFVEATGYVTVAERPLDWAELKTQLPPGTPRPSDADLAPFLGVFSSRTSGWIGGCFPMVELGARGGLASSFRPGEWTWWNGGPQWSMCATQTLLPMRSGVASGFRQRRNGSGRLGVDWKAPLFHGAKRPWVRGMSGATFGQGGFRWRIPCAMATTERPQWDRTHPTGTRSV